jgi:hypothetical protein
MKLPASMVMFCIAVHDSSWAATEKAQQLPQPPCTQSTHHRRTLVAARHVWVDNNVDVCMLHYTRQL